MSLKFLVILTEFLSELNRKIVWVHVRNYKSNYGKIILLLENTNNSKITMKVIFF